MFKKFATAATAVVLSTSLVYAYPTTEAAAPAQVAVTNSYDVAGTAGMDRRGGRRDTRQDCRQSEGLVGKDKRDCKQATRG